MTASLRATFIRNVSLNAIAKIVTVVLSAITNVVLARHLTARDYGIVSFALIFVNLFTQFNDFGINSAVIQRRQLDDRTLHTGFTLKAVLGMLVFGVSLACAPLSGYFFSEAVIADVIRVLSLNFLLTTLAFIPTTLLTRDLDFGKLMTGQIGASVMSSLVSVILALNGHKYWSIVVGNVCATLVTVILLNSMKPARTSFAFDSRIARELMQFGGKLFLSQLVIFAIINADNLVIGAAAGASALGFYSLAFNWGSMASVYLASSILNVLFPTLSKFQDDRMRIKESFLKTMHVIAFVSVMANLCLFAVSREFLFLVLGHGTDKWLPSLEVLQIFCVYGIGRALLEPVGSVIMAIGRTDLFLKSTMVAAVIELVMLYPVLRSFGITGVASLVTLSYFVQYFVYYPALRREIRMEFSEIARAARPSVISGLCVCALLGIAGRFHAAPALPLFAFKLLLCPACFIIIHGMLSDWTLLKQARTILVSLKAENA